MSTKSVQFGLYERMQFIQLEQFLFKCILVEVIPYPW